MSDFLVSSTKHPTHSRRLLRVVHAVDQSSRPLSNAAI